MIRFRVLHVLSEARQNKPEGRNSMMFQIFIASMSKKHDTHKKNPKNVFNAAVGTNIMPEARDMNY